MKVLRDLIIRRTFSAGKKRKFVSGAMMGTIAAFTGIDSSEAASVETVLQDQVNGGAQYSIGGSSNGASVGWTFTVNSPDLIVTQLSTLTGASGNNDTISLWNLDTNELVTSVNSLANTDSWRTVELDEGVTLEEGGNYGILLTSSAGDQYRRVIESFTENSTGGDITYNNSVYNPISGAVPSSFSSLWNFPDAIGEFQWLVDFGYIDPNEAANSPDTVAVPTPAAFGLGALTLGLLGLRRGRHSRNQ
ncbi:hypothetical protein KS4_33030 [Poriferisphaera corsica]|uniref:DUF4082 domain-containing protein n=1 Tax=Poriferisphaera corsica TaxID=2528020 RepID=A0A517YYB4_9BACT|nr:DUF4082 domain-containing protein [Poriferisphaera corsica]QDU35222.1 hypothetical protein KS4_33030 [Poriferisphaera corsica]